MTQTKEKPMITKEEITNFYDVEVQAQEGLPTGLKNKGVFYHLVITEAETGVWDNEQLRLDVRTEVVSGEYAGKFGPRNTFSLGGYEGVRSNGKAFVITAEAQADLLVKFVQTVHPERIDFSKPVGKNTSGEYIGLDEETLEEIAEAIPGGEFIALVKKDKNGYMGWSHIHALSDAPPGFELEANSSLEFTL